jgi:hypothetical protein
MAIAVLVFILVLAVAAPLVGRDSRVDDVARRRRYLG